MICEFWVGEDSHWIGKTMIELEKEYEGIQILPSTINCLPTKPRHIPLEARDYVKCVGDYRLMRKVTHEGWIGEKWEGE